MRAVLPVVLYGVLSIAGCSSGGGGSGGPPPQFLPAALRGQTIPATAATYQISLASANGGYTVLRDREDVRTMVSTSLQGDSFQLLVDETLPLANLPVQANLQLALPPQGSSTSSNLSYPTANASLSHMAFGEWMVPISSSSSQGGFFAFGNVTPGAAIPSTGSAVYNGAFHSRAVVGSLLGISTQVIDGSFSATADFAARSVSVSTTNQIDASYNLSGNLSYASATNRLSGTLVTASGYSGSARANFFGPNAEELGGAFQLTRFNPICLFSTCVWLQDAYVGSFGARR
ncbi:MAG TPA: transferrin-binding protein-like solute binding protein [Burkholderiales bacterium]|nr:transferrin-binding protein-like solute binding protein [Burkholderiales bacterium]